MDHLDRLEQAAKHAEEDFLDREEYASRRGYDLAEVRAATRKIEELLRMYRAGELERGPDTGEFIDASIPAAGGTPRAYADKVSAMARGGAGPVRRMCSLGSGSEQPPLLAQGLEAIRSNSTSQPA